MNEGNTHEEILNKQHQNFDAPVEEISASAGRNPPRAGEAHALE